MSQAHEVASANPLRRTALVVDDEPDIRHLVAAVLERGGWSVTEASDAADAVSAAASLPAVDLLVTDFEMPGATGLTLAGALRHRDAALPVLLVSGAEVAGPLPADPFVFVRKPFAIAELLDRVRSLTAAR